MSQQSTFMCGKYEALTHCIEDADMAQAYFEVCVKETMRSGFDHESAVRIERENISNYAKRFDMFTQRRIKTLFMNKTGKKTKLA